MSKGTVKFFNETKSFGRMAVGGSKNMTLKGQKILQN
jgi:cold shock CspA family protein